MTTVQGPVTTCPNCQATVLRGAQRCSKCKLEVARMKAFAAAKRAAQEKGLGNTQVETGPPPIWMRPMPIVIAAVVLVAAVLLLARPASAPSWSKLPTNQVDVSRELLTDISAGTDEGYDRAYRLVAPSVKNARDSDEDGKYRQLYHVMNKYLSEEIGSDWISQLTLEPDKDNPNLVAAHIGAETLHVRTAEQTPADKIHQAAGPVHHYAIEGIDEFDISEASGLQQAAGIMAVVNGYAGKGAGNNLQTIMSSLGGRGHHESAMQTKLRLLPNLRDPRHVTRMAVIRSWPVRKDGVMRARLQQIVNDGRYANDIQQTAQEVLNDNVSEEELTAAGVE